MSATERSAVSDRMRRYWAARRGGSTAKGATGSESVAQTSKAAGSAAKRGPRTMSPEARKRISDAQKARWANQRGDVKAPTGTEPAKRSAKTRERATSKRTSRGAAKREVRKVSEAGRKRMSQAQKKRWAAKRASQ
jgi:hypothetical protein